MTIAALTSIGKVVGDVGISPDGAYFVYGVDETPKQTLWVRQVATGSAVKIAEVSVGFFGGTTFSPDGSFVYYTFISPDVAGGDLYRVPTLGGEPRKILSQVASPVAFSPDRRQIAFVRDQGQALLVANADGSGQRTLAVQKIPKGWFPTHGASWTPDGKYIAVGWGTTEGGFGFQPALVSVADGSIRPLTKKRWLSVGRVLALHDGSGFVFAAADNNTQLWFTDYAGNTRRITNDLNNYGTTSVAIPGDERAIATAQFHSFSNLATLPAGGGGEARQVTSGDTQDGLGGLDVGAGGAVAYLSSPGGKPAVTYLAPGATSPRVLSEVIGGNPVIAPDGKAVLFEAVKGKGVNVWRVDTDGGSERQVTTGDADGEPAITPDGQWLWFTHWAEGKPALYKQPLGSSGAATRSDIPGHRPRFSPDGKWLLVFLDDVAANRQVNVLYSGDGSQKVRPIELPLHSNPQEVRWTPDSQALSFQRSENGADNIWLQPLSGGEPKQLTRFKDGNIFTHAWSPDGKQLILARGHQNADVVLIRDWR